MIDQNRNHSRGVSKCGSPPNQPWLLCTCKEGGERHKKHGKNKPNTSSHEGIRSGSSPNMPLCLCTCKQPVERHKIWVQVSHTSTYCLPAMLNVFKHAYQLAYLKWGDQHKYMPCHISKHTNWWQLACSKRVKIYTWRQHLVPNLVSSNRLLSNRQKLNH